MNSVFVALIFNFCAGITPTWELQLGYQSEGECIVRIEADDSNPPEHGAGVVINSHTLNWIFLDGGAEVTVDDQRFVIMAFREA